MLRLRNFIWLQIILVLTACNSSNTVDYAKLEFQRQGGGNKEFFILKQNFANEIKVNVTKYNFKDTTFTVILTRDEVAQDIITSLTQLFEGEFKIEGDFRQPTLPTGTWAYIYVIDSNSVSNEITNTQLRNIILKLEPILTNKINM